jgi:hypothetical protein
MRIWDALVESGLADVPRPVDESRVHSTELDCDRALIFGRGPALGLGVLSHKLALSGWLARSLFDRTGHAVDVTVVADRTVSLRSAVSRLAALPLKGFDAIILTFGAREASTLIDLRRWDREMRSLLDFLDRNCPQTHVFVLGIQPDRSSATFDSRFGAIADLHAETLNAATKKMCAEFSRTLFVPSTAVPHPLPGRFRSAAEYRYWGEILADRMAGPLEAERILRMPA